MVESMKYCMQGFLLIEIMIALTIFTTVSMMLAHQYWQASALQQDAKLYVEATQLANKTLQEVANNKQVISSKIVGSYEASCESHPMKSCELRNFRVVKVIVSWQGANGEEKNITLASGMVV